MCFCELFDEFSVKTLTYNMMIAIIWLFDIAYMFAYTLFNTL